MDFTLQQFGKTENFGAVLQKNELLAALKTWHLGHRNLLPSPGTPMLVFTRFQSQGTINHCVP